MLLVVQEAEGAVVAAGQSVEHHFLASYYHAILSVVLAQFSHTGFTDGMTGIVELAQASPYLQASLPHRLQPAVSLH